MVRNAVDHGAESPAERLAAGKSDTATLRIEAQQRDDEVVIKIVDDGRGLDPQKLRAKAVAKGILAPNAKIEDREALSLILEPGFSTKDEVSDISGRGVGMDVVANTARELKGSLGIESALGKGTEFTLTLPLSLSIIEGLVVGVGNQKYIVPLTQLSETIDSRKVRVESIRGKETVLHLRGEIIPFLDCAHLLGHKQASGAAPSRLGIVARCRGRRIGFAVDAILGQQSIVLKPLSPKCQGLPGLLGGAVLGDGEPALVLDLAEFQSAWSVKNAVA